jgi:hypothetical protein
VTAPRPKPIWPRRPRTPGPTDAHLDDLLRFDDAGPPVPRPTGPQPWLLRSALTAFAASAVVYTAFHIVNLAPGYPLILAVCLGAVLIRQATRVTREPEWRRTRDAVRRKAERRIESGGWYEGGDGMVEAVRRWHRRLEWGSSGPERFDATLALRLGELADERLRLRHSLTREADPARARSLLGDDVWALLHGQHSRVPTNREIAAVMRRLESL